MRKGAIPVTKNMYTVAGDGPCNEELTLRMQAGDKNAAGRLVSQNEGYLCGSSVPGIDVLSVVFSLYRPKWGISA